MGTLSLTLPTPGSTPNSTADPQLVNALTAVQTLLNGNIDGANVAATVTGRRLLHRGGLGLGAGGGTFTKSLITAVTSDPGFFYLDPANYAVVSKANTQLILKASLGMNNTLPGVDFTFGLYPVTFGGAGFYSVTPGTVVGGSSVTITAASMSAPNAAYQSETSPLACPAAGFYALALTTSGATAANFLGSVDARLFVLNS